MHIKHSQIFSSAGEFDNAKENGRIDSANILFDSFIFYDEGPFQSLCQIYSCENFADQISYFDVSVVSATVGSNENGYALVVKLPIANGKAFVLDGMLLDDNGIAQLNQIDNLDSNDLSALYNSETNEFVILYEPAQNGNSNKKFTKDVINKIISADSFEIFEFRSNNQGAIQTVNDNEPRGFALSSAFDQALGTANGQERIALLKDLMNLSDFYLVSGFQSQLMTSADLSIFNNVKIINFLSDKAQPASGYAVGIANDLSKIQYQVRSMSMIDDKYSNMMIIPDGTGNTICLQSPVDSLYFPIGVMRDNILPIVNAKRYVCVYAPYWEFTADNSCNASNVIWSDMLFFIDPEDYQNIINNA